MSQRSSKDSRSLYHRWRSRSFSEVVGQEHVTRTLRNAVATGRTVHAYLFCGPRGTGKTSTARILAKAVNCLDPQDGEPCNRCVSCITMAEGRAMDLIEIDAASNRGIDDARELRDKIRFSPGEARFKVYIIDECHMLTSEASNALLKTLEEPPEHAILILATTEAHKILPTISSRCQRFDFRRIPMEDIVGQLSMICEKEGVRAEPGVLERVARLARGSLRDAESLLDQLLAYCGDDVELAAAREVLGLTGEELVPELADALREADLVKGFQLIDQAATAGSDLRHLARELVEELRAIMVVRSGAETSLLREMRGDELARVQASADGWSIGRLMASLRAFGELDGRLRQEAFNQLHLELAFMEAVLDRADAASASPATPAVFLPERVRSPAPQAPETKVPASLAPAPASEQPVAPGQVVPVEPDPSTGDPGDGAEPSEGGLGGESQGDSAPAELTLPNVKSAWPRIVREGGPMFMSLGAGRPVQVAAGAVTVGFEGTGARFAVEKPTLKGKLEEALSSAFGTKVAVKFQYGVKFVDDATPPERDPVVEAAVKELGFQISRVELAAQDGGQG